MKIGFICVKCVSEVRPPGVTVGKIFVHVNDIGVYEIACPRGHITKTLVIDPKHELLFESGAVALLDGYAREAVASFAASVERAYEFAVRAMLKASGIGDKEIANAWTRVAKQSERQLGAFLFVHLLALGEAPREFKGKWGKSDWVNFRNNTIHQGYMPSTEEATQFGEYCLAYIFDLLNAVQRKFPGAIQRMMTDLRAEIETAAGVGRIPGTFLRQVIIQTYLAGNDEFGKGTLRGWLDHMRPIIRKSDEHGRSL